MIDDLDPLLRALSRSAPTPQPEMADLLGYGKDLAGMNRDHDPLHARIAETFGVTSWSLRAASGAELNPDQAALALMEEVAVLCLQRYLRHAGAEIANLRKNAN